MRLPIIKSAVQYVQENDSVSLETGVSLLEHISQARGLKDEELNVIGELISNLCGAIEVSKSINEGVPEREALNAFMGRVMGSIDKN